MQQQAALQIKNNYSDVSEVNGLKTLFVNLFFIGEPGKGEPWVLVDAGLFGYASRISQKAAELFGPDNPPQAIILTHGHFDHVGALPILLKKWPDVKVYAHPLEMPYLTGKSAYPPPEPLAGGGLMSLLSWVYPSEPIDLGDKVLALSSNGAVPFLEGWRWIHTPGHAPGHVSLFRDSDRVLLAGDAFVTTNQNSLFSVITQRKEFHGPPRYFTCDWQLSYASLKKLMDLNPKFAGTGHGLPVSGEELVCGLERLLTNFEQSEIPVQSRYTRHPAFANENGVQDMPLPISYIVSKLAFTVLLIGSVVLGLAFIGKNQKRSI